MDLGQGLAAYCEQLKRDPAGTIASQFDPVAGVKQGARSAAEFMKQYGAEIGVGLAIVAVIIAIVFVRLRRSK